MFLGIEIGGTKLQVGLGSGDGRITALERRRVEPREGASGILAQIDEAYGVLRGRTGVGPSDLGAVGIGFGGPVDVARGLTTTSHTVEGWTNFPVAAWARERFHVPLVALENDADTAGLAEARFGAGVGHSPVLYLTIGSGIGGALILDGHIYRGAGAGAVEIGHLWVTDRAGGAGMVELERVASGWAIDEAGRRLARSRQDEGRDDWPVLKAAGGDPSTVSAFHVALAAADGDPDALLLLARASDALAEALRQAVTLLAPARIILGGGVSKIGEELWFRRIRRNLNETVFPPFRGTFEVVPTSLGEEVVIHGALALASDLASRSPP